MRKKFRQSVEHALESRPFNTPKGLVAQNLEEVLFGFPGGKHSTDRVWLYQRNGFGLEMVFGFYANFSDDDLICKVVPKGEYPVSGEGASVQFNGNLCTNPEGQNVQLRHSGRITIRSAVKRGDLEDAIRDVCPKEKSLAGISGNWPVRIGSTANVPNLIDQIFVYVYCIEQGKRKIRGDAPLPLFA